MKKSILMVAALMLAATSVFAAKKSPLTITDGTADFAKEEATIAVEVVFDGTTWEIEEDYKIWCGEDYEIRCKVALENLVRGLNEKSKGLKAQPEAADAKYKLVCKAANLERHQAVIGAWGQGIIYITGTIEIIDLATNTAVCKMKLDKFGGTRDFSITDGIGKMFKILGATVAELK